MRRIEKPWGYEILFAKTEKYAGKVLFIKKDARLSMQFHERKDECIYLHSGSLLFLHGASEAAAIELEMFPGDAQRILPGELHRLTALEDCLIFEVSTPELDDVVRLKDDYGREGTRE